jgi:hypothetical protein
MEGWYSGNALRDLGYQQTEDLFWNVEELGCSLFRLPEVLHGDRFSIIRSFIYSTIKMI